MAQRQSYHCRGSGSHKYSCLLSFPETHGLTERQEERRIAKFVMLDECCKAGAGVICTRSRCAAASSMLLRACSFSFCALSATTFASRSPILDLWRSLYALCLGVISGLSCRIDRDITYEARFCSRRRMRLLVPVPALSTAASAPSWESSKPLDGVLMLFRSKNSSGWRNESSEDSPSLQQCAQ